MEKIDLFKVVDNMKEEIISLRRDFHMHPEIGFDLDRTSSKVSELLNEWGLEVQTQIGRAGVVGVLRGKVKSGRTVALRADMDALPILEQNNNTYKSLYEGKMHACGHDGHTAMLLGAARVLSNVKDQINGNIKFIFQPAEEGPAPGGAKPMIEDGVLDGVDAIFGLHLTTVYPIGIAGVKEGSFMASTDLFEIKLTGKGGHAAIPHESVDAIALAAKFINDIQFMVSREIDPLEPLVVSIGTIDGGYASNVIADNVTMSGTIRTQSNEIRKYVIKKMDQILHHITEISGGNYNLNIIPGLPPLINDKESMRFIEKASKEVLGEKNVIILDKPSMGGEDFAYYLEKVPGAFIWLGARNEAKGKLNLMHHPKFDFDEDALILGAKLHIQYALDFLR